MNILLLSRYGWAGNSSRHRSLKYLPYLEREGMNIKVAPLVDDAYVENLYNGRRTDWIALFRAYVKRVQDLLSVRHFDLVWIERETLPYLPALPESCLDRLGIPYVIDYDDAIFHNYDQHRRWIVRSLLGRKIDQVMRHARLVVVGNSYLGDRAQKAGARWIEEVPTVVDLSKIDPGLEHRNEVFTIGWIGTPPNARYLTSIAPALEEVCKGGRSRLVMVGVRRFELSGIPLTIRNWSLETEVSEIQRFDAGIMPLPHSPFERGKCGYKLLQYFACARPGVASPVGVNSSIVENGVNGFLASTTKEWIDALMILREDPDLRKRMGVAGRQKVEQHYSLEKTAPRLASLLRKAAS
ncbi:MAG: glycosyltransferase family 4 protein [Acidobacteria bacterium]|nr:glycosyltransferase family 4 protein [Acidobacteriota bacterium]